MPRYKNKETGLEQDLPAQVAEVFGDDYEMVAEESYDEKAAREAKEAQAAAEVDKVDVSEVDDGSIAGEAAPVEATGTAPAEAPAPADTKQDGA